MIFAIRAQQIILFSLALTICLGLSAKVAAQSAASPLLIYQVQTGSAASATQEYIAIYNNTNQPVEVTDWCVTYSSSTDVSQSQLGCLKSPNTATKLLLPSHMSLTLATTDMMQSHPGFSPDVVFPAGIASTAGHIKLLDPAKHIVDIVGWGTAAHPEGLAAPAPAPGKILQRISSAESIQDTGNNASDFYQAILTTLTAKNIYEESIVLENIPMPILSEIMPDAAGADSGKEFIELYNPTDQPIDLSSYSLALGPAFSKLYPLPSKVLEPKNYLSFNDIETGLTLPNTGATLRLIGPYDKVPDEVTYTDLEEDMSLAYIDGNWEETYQPTPGDKNILVAIKPCPEGETRNPDSGQCKTISLAASIIECRAGQIRNPETGRCKNIAAAATTITTACKAGQEKNPATNRCRNIPTADAAKSCPAGQERNPETGRCKKITALASTGANGVKDVPSALITNNAKWWIAGAAATGTITYGLYEWRHELAGFASKLKNRLVTN